MLDEVELLVAGRGPEVVADDLQALPFLLAFLVDDRDARLLAERGIGQHHVVSGRLGRCRRLSLVSTVDRALGAVGADPVEQQVHRAEAGHAVDDLDTLEGVELQVLLLVLVQAGVVRSTMKSWAASRNPPVPQAGS